MSHPRPSEPSQDEARAIQAAVDASKKKEAGKKSSSSSTAATLIAAVALAVGAAAGVVFLLDAWSANEDMKPILPPPPSADTDKAVGPPPRPGVPPPQPLARPPEPAAEASKVAVEAGKTQASGGAKVAPRPGGPTGTIDVDCKPPCDIDVDGRPTGKKSPAMGVAVAAGTRKVRVYNRELNLSMDDVVEVKEGQATARRYNLVLQTKN